jgi:DNA-binding IclR family transcriptional regulator
LDQFESPATLKVSTPVGTFVPLHCTALGKVLLAFGVSPIPEVLPAHTPRTISDPAILRIHLEQTCQQGYAIDDEEYEIGVRCIAAPVYDFRGKVVAAMGISGPTVRIGLEDTAKLAATVVEVVGTLSEQLKFKGDRAPDQQLSQND